MMPLWLLLVGRFITEDSTNNSDDSLPRTNLEIPFFEIIKQILLFSIPTIVGILIKQFLPKVAKFFKKIFRPFAFGVLIIIFPFMIYTHLPLFKTFAIYWFAFPIVATLPYFGFLFGLLVPLILRMEKRDIITISFETGIQNYGIAFFILKFSTPHPEGDIGLVFGMMIALITPLPIYVIAIIRCIIKRTCCTKFETLKTKINSRINAKQNNSKEVSILPESSKKMNSDDIQKLHNSSECLNSLTGTNVQISSGENLNENQILIENGMNDTKI